MSISKLDVFCCLLGGCFVNYQYISFYIIVLLYLYPVPCRPYRYGQWSKSSLEKSIAELEKGSISSVQRAALIYGIPRSTLHDHYKGKIGPDARPSPEPYLSIEEEEELTIFLIRIGYPKTRQQVLGIVQEIVSKHRPDVTVTNGWWERFSKRHPNVCLETSVPLYV